MVCQLAKQGIHRPLLHNAHLVAVQRREGLRNGANQPWFAGNGVGKVQRITGRHRVIQATQRGVEPAIVEVKGEIGKAALYRRIAIVDLARLE